MAAAQEDEEAVIAHCAYSFCKVKWCFEQKNGFVPENSVLRKTGASETWALCLVLSMNVLCLRSSSLVNAGLPACYSRLGTCGLRNRAEVWMSNRLRASRMHSSTVTGLGCERPRVEWLFHGVLGHSPASWGLPRISLDCR